MYYLPSDVSVLGRDVIFLFFLFLHKFELILDYKDPGQTCLKIAQMSRQSKIKDKKSKRTHDRQVIRSFRSCIL